MSKLFPLIALCLFSSVSWSQRLPEKIHLVSLKCNVSPIESGVTNESKEFFFLNAYIYSGKKLSLEAADKSHGLKIKSDHNVSLTNFYKYSHSGRVNREHKYGDFLFSASEYEFIVGKHARQSYEDIEGRHIFYYWTTNEYGGPHSHTIDRTSLILTTFVHQNIDVDDRKTKLDIDPYTYTKFDSYEQQCSIAAEGDAEKWEKEINDPLDQTLKNKEEEALEEIIKKRKI